MLRRTSLLLSMSVLVATSAEAGPQPGEAPPPITLERLLQAPSDARASWDALEGEVVVLEFWATWCGPCVAAIPHLNKLAEKYEDKPVRFISITDEPREKIEAFLQKRPIKAWVGLDTDRSMHRDYGIKAIPHTVLIGLDGKVAAVTYPTAVTSAVLDNLLAGKPAGLLVPRDAPVVDGDDGAAPPLYEVVIRPSRGDSAGMSNSPTHVMYRGQPLAVIIAGLSGTRPSRVVGDELPGDRLDARVSIPNGSDGEASKTLLHAIESVFDLTLTRETRDMDVLVLTLPARPSKGLTPTASTGGTSMSWGGGMISAVNYDLNGLSGTLEEYVKRPVVDESGVKDRFDIELDIADESPEAAITAAREQLGVVLTPARRPVEVVVARRHVP